ncbi:ras-like protein family member 12 [Fundulus heteroclitus]|uniref:small monomeric GTPase n=1 Tax=Fundulus heteroclitus TaxID=8078 RepID=A0A3Q2PX01_FUNHE|nr:ras-like protein family member 12 [Fundulus heteroclitus]XP_021171655.1 ras-like protein family member 12 [Fundulus heteroclitus]XP_021171656.1 ras-like protein family member 12 [Fundulus heteroclitus]XP_035992207.1 ras-like protein family member 12 [Fundulus heteroclitus]
MSVMFGKAKPCAECNLVLLGVMGSGKSALTVKFLTKRFISEYDPYLEDIYSTDEVVDQQPVTVRVMDTWDQEGPVNCERYLSWADAFLVVYSIDDKESFKGCQLYLQALSLHNNTFRSQTPILLVGNKLDMDRYRQVSQSDGEALAARFGCSFFEVSACWDFQSVQHIFYEAVRRAKRGSEHSSLLNVSEDKALLGVHSFPTPCYREMPVPATAKLVTVKTSRAQSKRRAATLTLLKGFKIF